MKQESKLKMYRVQCIEKVQALYEVQAESEEQALEVFNTCGEFLEYMDFIDTQEDSAKIF